MSHKIELFVSPSPLSDVLYFSIALLFAPQNPPLNSHKLGVKLHLIWKSSIVLSFIDAFCRWTNITTTIVILNARWRTLPHATSTSHCRAIRLSSHTLWIFINRHTHIAAATATTTSTTHTPLNKHCNWAKGIKKQANMTFSMFANTHYRPPARLPSPSHITNSCTVCVGFRL